MSHIYNQIGNYDLAKTWMVQHARPLEMALFQYHFEHGSKAAVYECLRQYQNPDGGFGHALEADCWNPESTAIQTWKAIKLLEDIDAFDANPVMVQGILTYLEQHFDRSIQRWPATIPSNDDYPHAPWWAYDPKRNLQHNPSASLAAFVLRFGSATTPFYQDIMAMVHSMIQSYMEAGGCGNILVLDCYMDLLRYMDDAMFDIDLEVFQAMVIKEFHILLKSEQPDWGKAYTCRPSAFISSHQDLGYSGNEALIKAECEWLLKTQQSDGTWELDWTWDSSQPAWFISEQWWMAERILLHYRFLYKFAS